MLILLIDDEPSIRLSLSAALRADGHDVIVAEDGNDGMHKLRAQRFDLVVADVCMPGPDGHTILQYAKLASRAANIILMTGRGELSDAVAALKLEATDFLVKPFPPTELVNRVRAITEQQTSQASPSPSIQPLDAAVAGFERRYLLHALTVANGDKHRAAELLAISETHLWEKLRGHRISEAEVSSQRD